ncbi:hypothetical protein SH1V18_47780 [Vallitalea longa]|uniref:Uncharacterized protein n=1 Tax=Vallitalea longa TaxID=2936439 RepID=A0A9W6DIA5_9FIRM|nr:hypothetical protein [Vallitalea longa]GKX32298.1 hypothetical protein SH1V18_47780 [Vallitalea longa]
MNLKRNEKGEIGVFELILFTGIVLFILMPIFTAAYEKQIMYKIGRDSNDIIKDSLEATYVTLNIKRGSTKKIEFDDKFKRTFESYIRENMKLNVDFTPKDESMADAKIKVLELKRINYPRKSVKVKLLLPIKPHLYRQIILDLMGKEWIGYEIVQEVSLPVDY